MCVIYKYTFISESLPELNIWVGEWYIYQDVDP